MPRRPKPSTAELVESAEPFVLNKRNRVALAGMLLERSPRYPVKHHELIRIIKLRAKLEGKTLSSDLSHEVASLKIEMDEVFSRLPKVFEINGYDDEKLGEYIDLKDDPICAEFFLTLEQAVDSYFADLKHDKKRPNLSQFRESLRLLSKEASAFEKKLKVVDPTVEAYLNQFDVEIEVLIDKMSSIQTAYSESRSIEKGKSNQARYNFCSSIANALNLIGLTASTSRLGLMEDFIIMMSEIMEVDSFIDIQDTLRAVLAK